MLKDAARTTLRHFGYELRRADAPLHTMRRGLELLAARIGNSGFVVMDIGVAQGTPELYEAFPAARNKYLLVEANPQYAGTLPKLAAELHGEVALAFCGSAPGKRSLNLYGDGRKASAYATKGTVAESAVEVEVAPLDALAASHGLASGPVVLKVDVEGAELEVLRGARETLKRASAVILEASLVPRYEGGASFADLVAFMHAEGFEVFDIVGGGVVGTRLYLVDLVFVPAHTL